MLITKYSDICNEDTSLRPYQQKAKKEIFESWDEVDNVMFQMPTGTGKTRLFTSIISDINKYSIKRREAVKILIIAHRTELIDQIDESLTKYHVAHNVIAGGRERNYKYPVSVASIQTITNQRNLKEAIKLKVQFIIIDEAHHALATSYKKLWKMYPAAKTLGVTATPWRMNHHSFMPLFNKLVLSMPVKDFIKQGYLAPYKYFSLKGDNDIQKTIDNIELDKFGEYKESSMEEKMDIGSIRAQLLDSYLALAEGKKGIIYAINIVHARHICSEYQKAGYKAVSIDSKTPASERKDLVNKFKKGLIDIIVNVDIFSEGFDCPDIEFIQLARPTRSLVKYLQQVGRGLRPTENKQDCVILDNVGMYSRFGLPDARRHWKYHFIGKDIDETPKRFILKGNGSPRFVDISEGTEDMELIQDVSEEVEQQDNLVFGDGEIENKEKVNVNSSSPIDIFFPLFGVTLGKTTWAELEKKGITVEKEKRGKDRHARVHGIAFWDHNADGVFTSIYWTKHNSDFPTEWEKVGFSWDNSFDEWMEVFKAMNYKISILSQQTRVMYSKRMTLSAKFEATSPDGSLEFHLDFCYGEKGCYSTSPSSLYLIIIRYHGAIIQEEKSEAVELFEDNNGISYEKGKDKLVNYPNASQFDSIKIPYFITTLGAKSFKDNKTKEIILHDEVIELEDSVFEGCQNLKTITMETETPDDILIHEDAFAGFDVDECVLRVPFDALRTYKEDERFTDFKYITAIEGNRCLKYDEDGKKIVGSDEEISGLLDIPEGVVSINEKAFENNEQINKVIFPESLETIGNRCFAGCKGISSITLPDSLEDIGYDAFRNTGLTEVEIPCDVKDVGASAFNCEIEVDSSNTDLYSIDGVLYDYYETKLIIYPSNRKEKNYEVPDDVEEIGYFAFEDSSLEFISLPDTINKLETSIFFGCDNLCKLEIKVENPEDIDIDEDAFDGFEKQKCKLIVPNGSKTQYKSHPMFKDFKKIEEVDEENNEEKEETKIVEFPIGYKTGQFFTSLSEPILLESKEFCSYRGVKYCKVVMTSKGFFLKLMYSGYYFLSEPVSKFTQGYIWIKNQKGKLKSYSACYFSSELNIDKPFGHFTEGSDSRTLMYRDFKSYSTFTLDLKIGKKIF